MPITVIARQNIVLQIFCGVVAALAAWALLHHAENMAETLGGALAAALAILCFYRLLMMRGRGIWIADQRVFLNSRRGIALNDITDARMGTDELWLAIFPVTLKMIELHGAGGRLGWVPAILLLGKRDAILTRLNEAIARYRAAGGPSTAP